MNNAVGKKSGYRVGELWRHYRSLLAPDGLEKAVSWQERIKEKVFKYVSWEEYSKAVLGTLTFWNAFQYVNYSHIPEELRTPSTIAVSFCWTLFLTLWSGMSSKKVMLEKN